MSPVAFTFNGIKTNQDKRNIGILVKAEQTSTYTLRLTFYDGLVREMDFEPILRKYGMYKRFLKPENFAKFRIVHGSLEWPGNVLDFHYLSLRV